MYAAQGQLGAGHVELVGRLDAGGADAIAASQADAGEEQLLDRAAMESGND
jgi:argininosuccinate synthase